MSHRMAEETTSAAETLEARVLFASTTVLRDSFEGGYLGGWTNRTDAGADAATRWGLNDARAAGGRQSAFAAALRGGVSSASGYRNHQANSLVRENVSLAGFQSATLAFDYFLDSEPGYDTFSVAVVDAAGVRTTVFAESGNFESAGWRRKTLDLGAFAGRRDLDLEFRFVTDSSVTHPGGGAWLDELTLTGHTIPPSGSVAGRLFDDANGNRTRDAGERPLAGWVVYFDQNRSGARDPGEPARTTGADGRYAFTGLTPGTYHVAEVVPAGFAQTSPGRGGASSGSAFDVEVVFPDTTLTAAQRAAFADAAARWAQVIVGDVPDVNDNGMVVDDIRITATAPAIDGRGGVLGRAAPTAFRGGGASGLPYRGFMEFDAADLARLEADGQLARVILHEMGHVLGFGTVWEARDLVRGGGGPDPRYAGPHAIGQYNAVFNNAATSVPVESTGGPGTADSHWRDATFGSELMTGFLDGGRNPLSRVTVGAMADLGYAVSYAAADPYAWPGASSALASPAPGDPALLPHSHTVYVGPGRAQTGVDFGNRRTANGSIAGTVFHDRNGNGVRDAGEPAQSGWRVYLDANRNQRFDPGERNVVTGSSGGYTFTDLPAGTYAVREVDQPGWTRPAGSPVVKLAAGSAVVNVNIGNFHNASTAGVQRLAATRGQAMGSKGVANVTATLSAALVLDLRPAGQTGAAEG
jgi:hypothetical protein